MVPAAIVDRALDELTPLLAKDSIVIDGGNSFYRDDIRRAAALQAKGLQTPNPLRVRQASAKIDFPIT